MHPRDGGNRIDVSDDADARMGYHAKTSNNRISFVYGYQLIAFTRIGPYSPTCREMEPPALVDRVALVPGNEKGLPETIALLDRLDASGTPLQPPKTRNPDRT